MTRIPVFTDDPGWHGKRLQQAFAVRGYQAVFISLKDCFFDLSAGLKGVVIPGFDKLPKFAFVRGVPGGTLQQVITRLDVLHALEMLGVKVYNTGRAVERTVDKAMTSFLLHHHGVATPDTWVCESRLEAEKLVCQASAQDAAVVSGYQNSAIGGQTTVVNGAVNSASKLTPFHPAIFGVAVTVLRSAEIKPAAQIPMASI